MTCWKCNAFFCWKCRKELSHEDPYFHYRNPRSECFNKLYHGLLLEEEDNEEEFEEFDNLLEVEDHFEDMYFVDDDGDEGRMLLNRVGDFEERGQIFKLRVSLFCLVSRV